MLWGQSLTLNPNTGLLCWLERSGPKDLGLLLQLRGSSNIHMGPGSRGTGAGVYWQSLGRRLSICLVKYATIFQTEIHAILACAHKIQTNARPEKCVSIFSDSQAALKTLQAAKTTSPLVQQCQKTLNVISTQHSVGLFCVHGHSDLWRNEIADELTRGVLFFSLLVLNLSWGSLGRI